MHPRSIPEIPEETQRVAQAAFPKGNLCMKMRDLLGTFYEDTDFSDLFAMQGQSALSPWRLALITILQFAENLTDRQAADAVRARIDWKYALSLELTDAGFHYSVLTEFRARLVEGEASDRLLNVMLEKFKAMGYLKARGKQRTDSTHVRAAIRSLNRLEIVGETLHHALNELAVAAPDWLKARVPAEWYDRYGQRIDEYRLPKEEAERLTLAETIGRDGYSLLEQLYHPETPFELRTLPAVQTLQRIWVQNFYLESGQVYYRQKGNLPPSSLLLSSPYDLEAKYSSKRDMQWVGYKAHLTETCDEALPHLVIHVETTPSTLPDAKMTATIHTQLAEKALLPQQHLVDSSYASSVLLVNSQTEYAIDLICPVPPDNSWQAKAKQGFDLPHFQIDWERQIVTCPAGKPSQTWCQKTLDQTVSVKFNPRDCKPCPLRSACTHNKTGARQLGFRPQREQLALQAARQRQRTDEFKQIYKLRSGVEGTISQAAHTLQMRQARYHGRSKTHLQNIITAAALNLARIIAWLDEKPRHSKTTSRFAALAVA